MAEEGGSSTSAMKMRWCSVPEGAKVHMALILFQFGHAGNHVLLKVALDMGISKLVFPFYRNVIALFVLIPSAYFSEKYGVLLSSHPTRKIGLL